MTRLIKYLKPFTLSLLIAILLLFVQAQCELALPDYMSRIVNTGIQANGIENAVPEVVKESTMNHLLLLVSENEKSILLNNYELIDKTNSSYDKYVKDYPILTTENVYRLNTTDKKVIKEIDGIIAKPLTLNFFISRMTPEQLQAQGIPEGTDFFAMLGSVDEQTRIGILQTMNQMLLQQDDLTISQMAKQAISDEYVAIGMDLFDFQFSYIMNAGLMMLGIALIGTLSAVLVGFLSSRIGAKLSRNLREEVFVKVENFSNAEFSKFATSSLITRTTNDVQQIQMVVIMALRIAVYSPIMGIGAAIKIMNSNVDMIWIIGLVLVLMLGIIAVAFFVVLPKFTIIQQLVDRLNQVMREFLDGMLVIRAFGREKEAEKRFDVANSDITKTNLFVNRAMGGIMPIMNLVMNVVILLIIWIGSQHVDAGTMEIGTMMAFMQYAMQVIMSFLMIAMISIMLPRASVAANRIADVLDTELTIIDPKNPQQFNSDMKGVVEFKNVSFRYPGAEKDVLHNISFKSKPGETTAIIGSTGSGKSTVINLIPRFFDVSEGEILVDGVNVKNVTQHDLRDIIGFTPQKGVLFSGTIESNLKYGKPEATDEEMVTAATIAQASDFIEEKTDKYQSEIAQGGTNVSGGQKQRLSIARAVIKQPEIYIFDDTFSALDFKTDSALRQALRKVTSKTKATVFVVAQRISTILNAEQIIVLDEGQIVGIGTHKQLISSCKVYQEIALSQLSKEELAHE